MRNVAVLREVVCAPGQTNLKFEAIFRLHPAPHFRALMLDISLWEVVYLIKAFELYRTSCWLCITRYMNLFNFNVPTGNSWMIPVTCFKLPKLHFPFLLSISLQHTILHTELLLNFKRKIRTWTGILTSNLQISSLALYHLSQARDLEVRGSNPGPGSNFSLEFKL